MTDDTLIDITNLRTFIWVAVVMMFFGAMVGAGIYVTFAGLHITFSQGLAIMVILFVTCGIIAYIPYLYRDYKMGWGVFAPDDEDEEDDRVMEHVNFPEMYRWLLVAGLLLAILSLIIIPVKAETFRPTQGDMVAVGSTVDVTGVMGFGEGFAYYGYSGDLESDPLYVYTLTRP